jgi:hypothetical protein
VYQRVSVDLQSASQFHKVTAHPINDKLINKFLNHFIIMLGPYPRRGRGGEGVQVTVSSQWMCHPNELVTCDKLIILTLCKVILLCKPKKRRVSWFANFKKKTTMNVSVCRISVV